MDDPVAAERWVERLVRRAKDLALFPESGRRLPERPRSTLRELIYGNYRIVYRATAKRVEVLTVFEGHRLLPQDDLPSDED